MSKIKILPEILSNKIAAGEVVERPASVVKELVENALDAQATRVTVEVEQGGRKLIRVADNGVGMGRDDALLAIERYATSKIAQDPDLFAINTLGFRGEALPSIASVSKFELVTRKEGADSGTQMIMDGGKIRNVKEIGAPQGTMITVRRLFFNTPARRKFMKTVATEMGHIGDTMARMALGWHRVRFRLVHNGKILKDWPQASAEERVAAVLGTGLGSELYPLEIDDGYITAKAWLGSPAKSRSTNRGIYLFVNNRVVRDRMLQHALFQGYAGRLMKGQYPVAVLFLSVPFDQVDVNVHPTKHEIRLAQPKRIHTAVKTAVADTLRRMDRPRWAAQQGEYGDGGAVTEGSGLAESVQTYQERKLDSGAGFKEQRLRRDFRERNGFSGPTKEGNGKRVMDEPIHRGPRRYPPNQAPRSDTSQTQPPQGFDLPPPIPSAPSPGLGEQTPLWQQKTFGDLKIIGQLHGTYIVCESTDGLVLIDQHAAHERIAFEALKRASQGQRVSSQRLLVPETVELGFKESALLEKMIPELAPFGLEIEPFGGNTYRINAVPTALQAGEIAPLILEMVEKAAEIGIETGMQKAMDECLILMACHNTIRAHQVLTREEMKQLLTQLDACDNPTHCPHGRPTWFRLSLRELEKSFRRIV